jgi:homeobox protein YOX1/YHP1
MSSHSRDDHYYASVAKSRRSSPGDAQGGMYFQTGHSVFQTGQGGRTVLPPLSSAFPTSRFPGLFFYVVLLKFNALNFLVHPV